MLNGNRALDLPGAFRILATAPALRCIGQLGLSKIPDEIGLLT